MCGLWTEGCEAAGAGQGAGCVDCGAGCVECGLRDVKLQELAKELVVWNVEQGVWIVD